MLAFDESFSGDETLRNLLTETGKTHGLPVEGLSAFIKDISLYLFNTKLLNIIITKKMTEKLITVNRVACMENTKW